MIDITGFVFVLIVLVSALLDKLFCEKEIKINKSKDGYSESWRDIND